MRLIDLDKAIEAMAKLEQEDNEAYGVSIPECFDSNRATKALNNIPTVQAVPQWISVSEKLPEDGQNVLFCDIDDDIMIGYRVKGRPNTHFSQDGTYEDMKNVKAWMPLPKPYEPQESEDA